MSLLLPDTGLLFWMLLIFGIVVFILAKWGFPIITGMVEKHNNHISESLRLAKEAERKMASLKEEQEKMIEQTRLEQGRILKEAAAARDNIISQARAQAAEESSKLIDQARSQIEAEKESALRDIRSQAALLSVEVAGKILRKELQQTPQQMELIDRMLDEVSQPKAN